MAQFDDRNIPTDSRPNRTNVEPLRPALLRRWRLACGLGGAITLALAMTLLAVLVAPPDRVCLVTVGADYATNLSVPHNAGGLKGLEELCRYGASAEEGHPRRPLLQTASATIVADREFQWKDVVKSMRGRAALLVVSLHGGADEEGPYLRREACSPGDDPGRLLRVKDLLHEMRGLPEAMHKVVVFDATMSSGSWRYGEVENDFVAGLLGLSREIESIPGLVVISASDVGQQSWRRAGGESTMFIDSLLDALRGAADDQDLNGRLDLGEVLASVEIRIGANANMLNREQSLLRLPAGGVGHERSLGLELALATPGYAPSPIQAATPSKEALNDNWAGVAEVTALLPNPESNAPLEWRRYRELLIRREQLLSVNASEAAQRVTEAIDDIEAELLNKGGVSRRGDDPVEINLENISGELRNAADAAFAELWSDDVGNYHAVAAKALSATPVVDHGRLRRLLLDRIVEVVYDEPQGRLHRGASLIDALRDPLVPLPADAHLLKVLAEGLPDDISSAEWREPLRQAIVTRRLSTAPLLRVESNDHGYVPELLPWLEGGLADADRERLWGEDLLFAGGSRLPEAAASLKAAAQSYRSLVADAKIIRQAFGARDHAYDLLGFYAAASENLLACTPESSDGIAELVNLTVEALLAANKLSDKLLIVDAGDEEPAQAFRELSELTQLTTDSVSSLRDAFRSFRASLANGPTIQLDLNQAAVLMTPDFEVSERTRLLATKKAGLGTSFKQVTTPKKQGAGRWLNEERARRVRLALATVGNRSFERYSKERDSYWSIMRAASEGSSDGVNRDVVKMCSEVTSRALNDAGQLVAMAMDANASSDERRERVAIATDAVRRFSNATPSPKPSLLEEVGRVNRYRYLLWSAQRSLDECWSDGQFGEGPRYQVLAAAYLEAADRLAPGRPSTDRLLKASQRPPQWMLNSPHTIELVSSVAPSISLEVGAFKSPLGRDIDGVATVSLGVSNGFKLLGSASDRIGVASSMARPDQEVATLTIAVDGDSKKARTDGALTLNGWFRGSRVGTSVALRNLAAPSLDYLEAPRQFGAGVAIIDARDDADVLGGGAVAVVLDASGSMGPGDDPNSKYRQAVAALQTLLRDMPSGVQVSVWVFGQAVGSTKTTDAPEATITRVLDPVRWDASDPQLAEGVIQALAYPRVEPWNESPLTRALLMASRDLSASKGYKSVIAITDGVDNRIAEDAFANPRRLPIHQLMKEELGDAGVAVQVIGFRVAAPEQSAARRQFAFLNQLSSGGGWWEVGELAGLERSLRAVFEQGHTLPLVVDDALSPSGMATVNRHQPTVAWPTSGVTAGVYRLPPINPGARPQKVLLGDSDLLMLATRQGAAGVHLAPASYLATQGGGRSVVEADEWRCGVLSDRLLPDGTRTTLVAIEQHGEGGEIKPTLQVQRPEFVWFEVNGEPIQELRWRRIDGYPAPCWEVEWPAGANSGQLSVWWAANGGPTPSVSIMSEGKLNQLDKSIGRSWQIDGVPVTLRRLASESERLPDASGDQMATQCLVVELRGATRCWTRLRGYATAARRHQWFNEANASVTTFWPVAAEVLNGAIEGIDVISVEAFKQEAASAGQFASFGDAKPTRDDYRPIPVVDWLGASGAAPVLDDARLYGGSVR